VSAAQEIRDERIPAFNHWFSEQALGEGFDIGIGLCSGPVMSGNVGAHDRLEYTAIGDTTNIAARLQAKNKETRTRLLMSESTRIRVGDGQFEFVYVGEFEVAGRQGPVRLWTVPERGDSSPRKAVARAGEESITSNQPPSGTVVRTEQAVTERDTS
jgi:adenylate cyclase